MRRRHHRSVPRHGPQLPRRAAGADQQPGTRRRDRPAQRLRRHQHLRAPRGQPLRRHRLGAGRRSRPDDPQRRQQRVPDPLQRRPRQLRSRGTLPAPIQTEDVGGDCSTNAALIGTGDCSNTIHEQFSQGGSAEDYVELRFEVDVPPDVISLSYDFAFFSVEYPVYFGSQFNDMYIGWLESELWTGNVSFDAMGNPISLNAGFLQYKDDGGNAPEFSGTCMRQHAGTDWLTTTAGVMPGEHITVAFAIFDLSDSILDSYAFIDNFGWGCDPTGVPSTEPEG
ncbi:MAG: choice-of-anchor L domain-containing protein [Deltaproteobacteria bacterium]|nr:choice-of-anchor L domain-containing protein [Deltaproteobacteria bacterium]